MVAIADIGTDTDTVAALPSPRGTVKASAAVAFTLVIAPRWWAFLRQRR